MGKCAQVSLVMLGISWPELWEPDCKFKSFQELMRGQVASFVAFPIWMVFLD